MKNVLSLLLVPLLLVFGALTATAGVTSCPSDDEKFCTLFKSAVLGKTSAQNKLGKMYEGGKGVDQDQREAYIWYTVANDNGSADAGRNLNKQWDLTSPEIQSAKKEAEQRYSQIRKQLNTAWWE